MNAKAATLSLGDERPSLELPILDGTDGSAVIDIRALYHDTGICAYDPGLVSTASCRSAITDIDGARGTLQYRGYPIEQLTERCSFLGVAYLILRGELPSDSQLEDFESAIRQHARVDEQIADLYKGFRRTAHPMALLCGAVSALSALYHDVTDIHDADSQEQSALRLIGQLPTLVAVIYKYISGQPFLYPRDSLPYVENFLYMMFGAPGRHWEPKPVLTRAMERMLIVQADHGQNASTSTVRLAGSTGADPIACMVAGLVSLWGPAHGGANEAVLKMLAEIGDEKNIPAFIQRVKNKEGHAMLMGFGHRVYKNYDPRARIIQGTCHEVLEALDLKDQKLFKLAIALEKIAMEDDYFVSRKLFPNVDFYSGIVYKALGIPESMFTTIFAVSRVVGWTAQWQELMGDADQKIVRPRQLYTGHARRNLAS